MIQFFYSKTHYGKQGQLLLYFQPYTYLLMIVDIFHDIHFLKTGIKKIAWVTCDILRIRQRNLLLEFIIICYMILTAADVL